MSDRWTAADMPDLAGKVIIVTGANSGIGYEAAKEFARKGAQTILACRNMLKARAALNHIEDEIPNALAATAQLDLASLASIRDFAAGIRGEYSRLDVLVNSAGILWAPYSKTEDGFESHFGTNHLGHFALTGLLVDMLLETPRSRVVTVSSLGHRLGRLDFGNLMFDEGQGYSRTGAYDRSKLANLLFTRELQRRYEAVGADTLAVAAHPGFARTGLSWRLDAIWLVRTLRPLEPLVAQTAAIGALPTLRAATDPSAVGGQYYGPGGLLQLRGHPIVVESTKASHDKPGARRLWHLSEQLTGVRYDLLGAAPVCPVPSGTGRRTSAG